MAYRTDWRLACTLLLAAAAVAQQPASNLDFRTGDGSRFVLLPQSGNSLVHWAIATPAGPTEDLPGNDGLAAALVEVSLNGTWLTGTRDPAVEREARQALDRALAAAMTAARGGAAVPELALSVESARRDLAAAADLQAFRRTLAAAPAQDTTVNHHTHAAVLSLTTTAAALPRVAELLLERREQSAMRGAFDAFVLRNAALAQQWDGDPFNLLRAEALSLAFPGDPLLRLADRPTLTMPDLAAVEACWQTTQQPARSVHVLLGGFDPVLVRTQLEKVFVVTALPLQPTAPSTTLRPLTGMRRSAVPGFAKPAAVLAWPIDRSTNRTIAETAAHWLAGGPESVVARELQRAGRPASLVLGRAPWPVMAPRAMLVIEAAAAQGEAKALADTCLQICRAAMAVTPSAPDLARMQRERLTLWEATTRDGRTCANKLAAQLLADPTTPVGPPPPPDAAAIQQFLRTVLAQNPVLVEGRQL